MHILFLTDNFPPEVNAPASRTYEHCREWVKAGHKVTIITCAPNFPKGKVFDGYKNRLVQSENIDGIKVIRVWTYISANEGFTLRTLDYLSFMVSAFFAALFVRKVDIVIGTSPQFFTACAAYMTGKIKRKPFVFELRDIWPESIRAVGALKSNRILDWLEKIELFLYRKSALIISVTHSFKSNLIARGIDGSKIKVVTNGVDKEKFFPLVKDQTLSKTHALSEKFVIGYIGTHGMAHGLETILEAAAYIQKYDKIDRFKFLFLGDGANKEAIVRRADELELSNVIFVDTVSKSDVVKYWSILDVSVIHLKKAELFNSVIPSKLFECMAMGIPILHGVEGESADIVTREHIGLLFEPSNPQALYEKIIYLDQNPDTLKQFIQNGPKAAKHYDRTHLAQKMLVELQQFGTQ